MPDIFKGLRRFSWRGIELPLVARRVRKAHEQVNHPLLYKDGKLVESTGAENWTFEYTIPFRENLFKGPYRNLYTRVLIDEFIPAYEDRTPGPLIDPHRGEFRCKALTYLSETDIDRRDGEDIQVSFTQAPEQDTSEETAGELASVESLDERAAFLDAAAKVAFLEADEPPPEPLFDPLDVITGIGAQLEIAGERVAAKADSYAFRAEKLEAKIAKLSRPQDAPVIRSLRRLRRSAGALSSRAINPAQVPITIKVSRNMGMTTLAAIYNMSLADLQRLNPTLRAFVKAGTNVKVYPSGGPI